MELNGIQILVRILRRRHGTIRRMGTDGKARRNLRYIIIMAHPANGFRRYILKQLAVGVHHYFNFSVLSDRRLLHLAAQHLHHNLRAITKPEHRNPHFKKLRRTSRCSRLVAAVRTSGQNNALRIHLPYFCQVRLIRINLTVDITLPDAARHQLIVLSAEIQYDYCFSLHFISPLLLCFHFKFYYTLAPKPLSKYISIPSYPLRFPIALSHFPPRYLNS